MSTKSSGALVALRRDLHASAELSHAERTTASRIEEFLRAHGPDRVVTGLGGQGLIAVYEGTGAGPTVVIRCELDALPIPEEAGPYRSETAGVSHRCGHDGHMAIVAGLAPILELSRPPSGRVVLLFQPAEETGEGARAVLDDERFAPWKPDLSFALHNLPGFPLGAIISREGAFAAASKGMVIRLVGETSHAGEPEKGRSPTRAVARLLEALPAAPGSPRQFDEPAVVTVIHARIGEIAFGTSPGEAVVMATLRAYSRPVMDELTERCDALARTIARAEALGHAVEWREEFPPTINDEAAARRVELAARALGYDIIAPERPFPWSEDFGHFIDAAPGALFGLGAGTRHPALHSTDYDFPDELLEVGTRMFADILEQALGGDE
jgi:amidohydrolase